MKKSKTLVEFRTDWGQDSCEKIWYISAKPDEIDDRHAEIFLPNFVKNWINAKIDKSGCAADIAISVTYAGKEWDKSIYDDGKVYLIARY